MTRIGIYTGNFSPPHNAHVTAVRAFMEQMWLDYLYVIPTPASAEETKGNTAPVRSGFVLNESDILSALGGQDDGGKSKKKNKDAAPLDSEDFRALEEKFRSSVSDIGKSIYSGNVPKTPSEDACRYCSLRGTCPSAVKSNG